MSSSSQSVYKCYICDVDVPSNNLINHSKTKRHKLLCCEESDEDFYTYIVNSSFKCRLACYRLNSCKNKLINMNPTRYLSEVSDKVKKILNIELETHQTIKVNLQLYCTFSMISENNDVIKDLKSFNTKNAVISNESEITSHYENFSEQILTKVSFFYFIIVVVVIV